MSNSAGEPSQQALTAGVAQEIEALFETREQHGRVSVEASDLERYGDDFGHRDVGRAEVVVVPRSVEDVRDTLMVANTHGVVVTPRGGGGNTEGQSVGQGGIVLVAGKLRGFQYAATESGTPVVRVGAGLNWDEVGDLIARENPEFELPIIPGYKHLSVGGTLSVGGGGYRSHRYGLQTDNVSELLVVTGAGTIVRATPTENADLFLSVLGGNGQFGIIVEATIPLVRSARGRGERPASYELSFERQDAFSDALLADDLGSVFTELKGDIHPTRSGWSYSLTGTVDGAQCSKRALQDRFPGARVRRILQFFGKGARNQVESKVYDLGLRFLRRWDSPHPWGNAFVPTGAAKKFIGEQLDRVHEAGLGLLGFVSVIPTRNVGRPYVYMQLPAGERYVSFGIFYMPDRAARTEELWEQLSEMQRDADSVGGKSFLADTLPASPEHWRQYFGDSLEQVLANKVAFDPKCVLKPANSSQAELWSSSSDD